MKKLILSVVLVLLYGCSDNSGYKERSAAAADVCIANGGVPLFSIWDYNTLTDCIYKPH